MSQVSSNADINRLIGYFDGDITLKNALGMSKLKKMIEQDPSSRDLCLFRDYLYKIMLDSEKNIQLLEKNLSNEIFIFTFIN